MHATDLHALIEKIEEGLLDISEIHDFDSALQYVIMLLAITLGGVLL